MQNKFCKFLSNSLSLRIPNDTNTVLFTPCCVYDVSNSIPFHPTLFKKERKKFIEATDFLPGCNRCKMEEITHGNSQRTRANEQIPNDIGSDIYKLELVLDTTCNAACIQCGSISSSLWRKEIADSNGNKKSSSKLQDPIQIDNHIRVIKENFDFNKIKKIHFWGGEPLITDTHLKILREIKDPENISLQYTTNGSTFPDKNVWDILKNFKDITFNISVDGVGNQFSYIRWPLGWNKVEKNLIGFRDYSTPNCRFLINFCVIPINLLYFSEFNNWVEINAKNMPGTHTNRIQFIRGEGNLDLAFTPPNLRERVLNEFGDNHTISKMLTEIPYKDYKPMVSHLDYWDVKRKLNWREIFKESSPYFLD
jgi:MoaA/NifB/PqqE/SkfB family radical SAM enzyme